MLAAAGRGQIFGLDLEGCVELGVWEGEVAKPRIPGRKQMCQGGEHDSFREESRRSAELEVGEWGKAWQGMGRDREAAWSEVEPWGPQGEQLIWPHARGPVEVLTSFGL